MYGKYGRTGQSVHTRVVLMAPSTETGPALDPSMAGITVRGRWMKQERVTRNHVQVSFTAGHLEIRPMGTLTL